MPRFLDREAVFISVMRLHHWSRFGGGVRISQIERFDGGHHLA
jgi:hypothetical protein